MLKLFQRVSMIVVAASLALAAAAHAADDFKICVDESGDVAIDACTRVIGSGRAPRAQVIESYRNRGVEWFIKKEYDKAIADATAAIKLAKDHSPSYYLRFRSYEAKGDEEHAKADLEQAISTDFNVEAYYSRGERKEKAGDTKGAIADYKAALENRKQKYDYITQQGFRDRASEALKRLSAQ